MKEDNLLDELMKRARQNKIEREHEMYNTLAAALHDLYEAYIKAGFDERQAFRLTEIHAQGVIKEAMR